MRYNQLTQEEFIDQCRKKHGHEYDYSLVEYTNTTNKIKIICKTHGVFEQTPRSHIYNNSGCPMCSGKFKTTESFIEESEVIHNYKYNYSLVNYVNNVTKVKIICKKHNIFEQTPNIHLCGKGCPKCAGKNKTTEDFIKESKKIHFDNFDYSSSDYIGAKNKIKIICSIHGEFEQTPTNHLRGKGCPICKESKGEKIIREFLKNNNISYIQNKRFDNCRDKYVLPFDFFIPKENICIEFDGIQHYESVNFFGGVDSLDIQKNHDKIKNNYCNNNNIKLFRIKYDEDIISKLTFIFSI